MNLRLKSISLPLARFDLELDLELTHQVTGLFGPSGAGKTSLLDLIAGLRKPKSALIQLGELVLTDTAKRIEVPARLRRISYVPQDLALFPHLSVRHNILYGHRPGIESSPLFKLEHVVRVLEMEPLLQRGIGDLSGGEKQRVALARALLASPGLLLLDEPLGGLDTRLKGQILPFLQRLRDEFPIPMLYVTHNTNEAAALCDEVVLLEEGHVTKRGVPGEVLKLSAESKGG